MTTSSEWIRHEVPSRLKSGGHLQVVARTLTAAAVLLAATASDIQAAAHGLPESAVEIARPFGFPITNSMVVTWIVAILLIVFAQVATRKMTAVPGGAQNFLEWLVQSVYEFLESIIGSHLVKRTFWFFATVFIFILAANWISLLPGVGTIVGTSDRPRLRDRTTALPRRQRRSEPDARDVAGVLRVVDLLGHSRGRALRTAHELFAPKGETTGALKGIDDLRVPGRRPAGDRLDPVPARILSFRLYGNIFAGENMLEAMATMVPGMAGCCRSPSTSWNCSWAWCRRWSSCC